MAPTSRLRGGRDRRPARFENGQAIGIDRLASSLKILLCIWADIISRDGAPARGRVPYPNSMLRNRIIAARPT